MDIPIIMMDSLANFSTTKIDDVFEIEDGILTIENKHVLLNIQSERHPVNLRKNVNENDYLVKRTLKKAVDLVLKKERDGHKVKGSLNGSNLYDICCNCYELSKNKLTMTLENGTYVCYTCGYTKIYIYDNEKHNLNSRTHNISNNSLMPLKIVGPDCHRYRSSLMRTSSDYKIYRRNNNIRMFRKYIDTIDPIPDDVLICAAKQFTDIQDAKYIIRADLKRGVCGSLISFECIRAGIPRKPSQIAALVGVMPIYLSKGDRYVRKLYEDGVIDVPIRYDLVPDYINQYFRLFDMDRKYKQFVLDLIKRIKIKITVKSSSNPSTCVIGIIWLLIIHLKLNITHKDVTDKSKTSKSTYTAVYKMILANEKGLRKSFHRHNIPIPSHWKQFKPKKICIVKRQYTKEYAKVPKLLCV